MFVLYSLTEANSLSMFDVMLQFLFVAVIFIFILFMAIITTRLVGGGKMKTMKNNNMKVMETIAIGTNYLHIVKVSEQYFLVSSSKEGIRMMSELELEEFNFGENQETFQFEKHLKSYINNFKTKDKIGGDNEQEE